MEQRAFRILSILFALVSFALLIAGLGANTWINDSTYGNAGLWNYCSSGSCGSIDNNCNVNFNGQSFQYTNCGDLNGARALAILAVILVFSTTVSKIMYLRCHMQGMKKFIVIKPCLAGAFGLIAAGLYVTFRNGNTPSGATQATLGGAFGVEIAGACLCFFLAAVNSQLVAADGTTSPKPADG